MIYANDANVLPLFAFHLLALGASIKKSFKINYAQVITVIFRADKMVKIDPRFFQQRFSQHLR